MDMLNKSVDSLVIVTTRDVGMLINSGITATYHLKGMHRDDARKLFCCHAFGEPHAASGYENLVDAFLNVCGDLPLSLQVMGRHLYGRDQSYWKLELNKVNKTLPRDIHRSLKISFDALDSEEKQIFMDIACFFINKSKTIAMRVWEGSGWNSQHAVETLKNKCLVEELEEGWTFKHGLKRLDWHNRPVLRMHDHLRDLGREMANKVGHPRRLWRRQDLEYLESLGFRDILAQTKDRCFHSFLDRSTDSKITYFLGESNVSAESSTSLLWLQLEYQGFQNQNQLKVDFKILQPCIPQWIPLKNLQCLKISNLQLETLWQSNVQAPSQLKELHIHQTLLNEFPDLLGISNKLEKVVLDSKYMKTEWWSLLGSLRMNLSSLNLRFSTLKGELICSSTQEGTPCKSLLIRNFKPGLKVDLSDRKKSGSVKAPFRGTENLEMRDIGVSKILVSGNYFPDLHTCKLYDMDNLFEVQLTRVETLKSLDVTNCKRLVRLSATSDLSKLVDLKISQCPLLQEFGVVYFSCLEKIVIQNCSLLQCVSGISNLKKLIELNICQCPELQQLSVIQLNHLKRFVIHNCSHLKILSGISDLTKLQELNISQCQALQQLNVLKSSNLEKIVFHNCSHLKIVSGISHLTKLVELNISQCPELQELGDLQSRNLKKIILRNCSHRKIKSISHLTKLVELEICESPVIGRLCLADLNSLKRITVDDYVKLTCFELAGCKNLKTISGILNLENLETSNISITGCPELEELPLLRGTSCLEMITIDGCRHLHRLHLSQFKNLKRVTGKFDLAELFISDCPELEELPCFARLTLLKEITIVSCGKLYSITLPTALVELRLESCRQLEKVAANCDHSECPEVGLLPCVARVSYLQWITIQSCEKLQTIQGIHELYSLKSMGLSYCSNVTIQNCIPMLKRVPSESLIFIGKAADEAYSTLSPHLFSDADSVIAEISTQGRDEKLKNSNQGSDEQEEISSQDRDEQEEISTQGSNEHESIWELNTVIVCALLMINVCTQIKMINKSLEDCYCNHWWPCDMQQGECIFTMVTTDQHKMNCFNDHRQFEDVLVKHGIMKKGYKMAVNKGEEGIIQRVLLTIVNKLYQK